MSWREKLRNPFVQQYAFEILLPLIGFFFFDWTITIIAVFYFVDQFASETAFVRKLHKISPSGAGVKIVLSVVIFLLLFSAQGFVVYDALKEIYNNDVAPIIAEIVVFAKEELWFLLPVVILLYHMKDQFMLYVPRRHLQYDANRLFQFRILCNVVIALLVAIAFVLWRMIELPDVAALLIFLVIKITFDFTFAKWIDRQSKKK